MADRPTEPIPPGGGSGQPPEQGRRSAGGTTAAAITSPTRLVAVVATRLGSRPDLGVVGFVAGHDGYLCRWGKGYAVAKDSYLLNHGSS
jgi:hypothetical protein